MTTITAMLGFTSYNPRREIIYAAAWLIGPFLIDKLSLKPTNVISQIDRIRENIFGVKTQFLTFTQTNALTEYTWIFLKNFPPCLAFSTLFVLVIYLDPKTVVNPYMFQSAKYALAIFISLIISAEAKKGNSRPKDFSYRPDRPAYLFDKSECVSGRGYKDTSRPLINLGGSHAINVGGYKNIFSPCVTRSQSLPTSPVGAKQLC